MKEIGKPNLLHDACPTWRYPRPGSNGSPKFLLKVVTLILFFALLGVFTSHLYLVARKDSYWSSHKADFSSTPPVNQWKGQEEASKDIKGKQPLYPQSGIAKQDGEKVGKPVTKPWYWKVSEKLASHKSEKPPKAHSETPLAPDLPDTKTSLSPHEEITAPKYTHGDRPYFGKVTINVGDPNDDVYERSIRTHVAHNKLHNYAMHILRYTLTSDYNQMWSKPAYLLSIILRELAKPPAERLQWLWWVDADTIILNPKVSAEIFLPPLGFGHAHFLVTEDFNGLNNGIFLIRVHLWSVEFLAAVMAFPHYNPSTPLPFHEQTAMTHILKDRKFSKNLIKLPQRWFNAYPAELNETAQAFQVRRGDLLIHFAGFGDRTEIMGHWLDRVSMHDPEWEMDLKFTSYPNEVKSFWEEQKQQHKETEKAARAAQKDAQDLIDDVKAYTKEYKARIDTMRLASIKDDIKKLRRLLDDEVNGDDPKQLRAAMQEFKEAAIPVLALAKAARKTLYKEAHDLLLQSEEQHKDIPIPDGAENQGKRVEDALSNLRKYLIDDGANPNVLERAIAEVNAANEALKRQFDFLDLPEEERERVEAFEHVNAEMEKNREEIKQAEADRLAEDRDELDEVLEEGDEELTEEGGPENLPNEDREGSLENTEYADSKGSETIPPGEDNWNGTPGLDEDLHRFAIDGLEDGEAGNVPSEEPIRRRMSPKRVWSPG